MSRLMSVAFTEQAVRDRRKTVTRRKGWLFAKSGDRITLCRKVMGRKKGEPLERIVDVELVSVLRLPLHYVTAPGELTKEGFPELEAWPGPFQGAQKFIERYFEPQGLGWEDEVTRIEWRYLCDCLIHPDRSMHADGDPFGCYCTCADDGNQDCVHGEKRRAS